MSKLMIELISRSNSAGISLVHGTVLLLALTCHCVFAQGLKSELKAPVPLTRVGGVAAVTKGKLYFIGGLTTAQDESVTGVVHAFDPIRNEWSLRAAMPTPRGLAAAVALNDFIYVLGGRRANEILSTVEKYDPVHNSWSTCAAMPTARWALMAVVVDSKIYALGGIVGVGNARHVIDTVEVYDPAKDSWSTLSAMPIGNSNAGAVVIGANIYIVGGRLKAGETAPGATPRVDIYNTASGKWDTGPSLNQERTGLKACTVGGKIFAIGGASRGEHRATIEVLTPGGQKWTLLQVLRARRAGHGCAVLGGRIYVVGGYSAPSVDALLNTMEELTPATLK